MKTRKGFVSNSSSSSFLVVDKSGNHVDIEITDKVIKVPHSFPDATLEFGRGCEDHRDFGSRLVFALALAYSMDAYQRKNGTKFDYLPSDEYWKKHSLSEYKHLVDRIRDALLEKFGRDKEVVFALAPYFYDEMGPDPLQYWKNPGERLRLPNKRGYDEDVDAIEYSVDHGSMWFEMPENLEIFRDEKTLSDFLFGRDSFVAERSDDYGAIDAELDPKKQWATIDISKLNRRMATEADE